MRRFVRVHSVVDELPVALELRAFAALSLDGDVDRVRAAVKVPVTTSEQWHIWQENPELADHVDLIAAHTGRVTTVELGSGRLIPGFKDQVVGAKAGEERQIKVTFPEEYQAKELAGQDATFDLVVKSVKTAGEGKLFGSVTAGDVAGAIKSAGGPAVDKRTVELPKGHIKSTGTFPVVVNLHPDVTATVQVDVVAA